MAVTIISNQKKRINSIQLQNYGRNEYDYVVMMNYGRILLFYVGIDVMLILLNNP